MCDEILAEDAPRPETFAELSAPALCVLLGAGSGHKLERRTTRTADWRMNWPPGVSVDVEVTTARRKREHVRRHEAANWLLSQFTARSRTDDLVVHIPDPTDADDVRRVVEAVNSIEPDRSIDVEGRWSVRRVPVSRDTFVIYQDFDPVPASWPRGVLRQMVFKVFLAGPDSTQAPGQVRILFGVPAVAYINPVMKKADRPQGEAGRPFLLAVDVFGLPGAFRDLPLQIESYFEQWTRVSGVLLFMDVPAADKSAWWWRLVSNPHAGARLPESLTSGRVNLSQTLETGIRFTPDPATT